MHVTKTAVSTRGFCEVLTHVCIALFPYVSIMYTRTISLHVQDAYACVLSLLPQPGSAMPLFLLFSVPALHPEL